MRFLCVIPLLLLSPSLRAESSPLKPILIQDILGWKRIHSAVVSNNGAWFAYRLTPNEGDSELVLRNLKNGSETRFPIGEVAVPGGFGGPRAVQGIAFSDDSAWLAFSVSPTRAAARKAKKDKKPLHQQAVLVELSSGKKTTFDKVKAFSFSGELGGWIALQKYTTEAQDKEPAASKWTGSDLLLRELSSGQELNLGNVSEFSFNKPGTYFAYTIDAMDKAGNGVQVRHMPSGSVIPLDSGKAVYKSLTWTEKGDGLAVLKGVDDKAYEDKLYGVVGCRNFSGAHFAKSEYNPKNDAAFPAGLTISANHRPLWTEDLAGISFGIAEARKKRSKEAQDERSAEVAKADPDAADIAAPSARTQAQKDEPDKPDMLVWHWRDRRLQPMQEVQQQQDKNFSFLSVYWVDEKKFVRLADNKIRQVSLAPHDKIAVGQDNNEYELASSLDGQQYHDIYVIDPKTGARKLALHKNRWFFGPSPDGARILYYQDGHFFAYDMNTGAVTNLTRGVAANFINTEDDHNVDKPPAPLVGWSADGASVLISDNWDIWRIPLKGAAVNLTGNGKREQIRYQTRFRLDADEKGIDLTKPVYFSAYGEWTKKGGIGIIAPGSSINKMLAWEDATYGSLMKAKHADTYLFTRQTVKDYPDYYTAGPDLASAQKITTANPQQKDYLWSSGAKIVDYTCDQGVKAQAALFLPANYDPAKKYPAIVYIYEKLSREMNTYGQPVIDDRFNRSVYNSNGYAVLMPDISYKLNDPGRSAVWCVLPALKAAIAAGVVDAGHVGLHGHSWGGYETAFLVTQTNVFKTAIAGAPLTDMVSMYSSVYWNTGSANQAIFESSQGRFTAGYMDNPEPYIRNSPVYHAQNVKTPLLILHNNKDGAVDFTQGIEYFNTLRRLHKPVVMLEYKGENHHLSKPENEKDFLVRMKEYYDHYLMDKPAPRWLEEGVPLIQLKDEIDDRVDSLTKAGEPVKTLPGGTKN